MTKNTETDVVGALKKVKNALESLRAKGADLDKQINEVKETIHRLQQAPISLEDFGVFLRATIVEKGRAWLKSVPASAFVSSSYLGQEAAFHHQPFDAFEAGSLIQHNIFRRLLSGEGAGDAIFAIFPDQVSATILENLKKEIGDTWGNDDAVPIAERRTLIASLKKECAGLEAQRSALQNEIDAMVEVLS